MVPNRADGDPHVIRLHGPWKAVQCGVRKAECGLEGRKSEVGGRQSQSRVKVPLDVGHWLDADFRGTVALERAFGLPTNLNDQQSVWLVLQTNQLTIDSVSLNETALIEGDGSNNLASFTEVISMPDPNVDSNGLSSHRYDIGSYLAARNRLRITLAIDAPPAGGLPHVAIEIVD